jgi:hypothetical protein
MTTKSRKWITMAILAALAIVLATVLVACTSLNDSPNHSDSTAQRGGTTEYDVEGEDAAPPAGGYMDESLVPPGADVGKGGPARVRADGTFVSTPVEYAPGYDGPKPSHEEFVFIYYYFPEEGGYPYYIYGWRPE